MKKERRYDIDWIRVIVFDTLIIYHVAMFFVPWDWELKNNETVDWIKWPMLFINLWRLPILFVISGMGTRFALSYRSGGQFVKERISRLFVPLLAGILLMVAPQIYLVRQAEGRGYSSFLDFYPDFFNGFYPEGNFSWGHLWFLPYLLVMSLLATPIFLYLRKENNAITAFTMLVWSWFNIDNLYLTAFFSSINKWSWILAVFGFSATSLNKESKVIKYRNQAVYPFYLLHQTIIILIGFYLMDSSIPVSLKAVIMVASTFGGCWIIYEFLIRRISLLKLLFGVRR